MKELTDLEKKAIGQSIAEQLGLKKSSAFKDVYTTGYGGKSAIGIYELILTLAYSIKENPDSFL